MAPPISPTPQVTPTLDTRRRRRLLRGDTALTVILLAACARSSHLPAGFASSGSFGEVTRVLAIEPGVTATVVAPARLDARAPVELILYALPNGNTTAQTMGKRLAPGDDWHYDIQHVAAQTRSLRARGVPQAVVVYLEADGRSWPAWRARQGYDRANARLVRIVDTLRSVVGDPSRMRVTLTGHSGGGSLMFGWLDALDTIPPWLGRIAFLDANYNYDRRHAPKLAGWLRRDAANTLVVLAYDDRNIMLDGKKVVSDSGGTWRASQRMLRDLGSTFAPDSDMLGEFVRRRGPQVEILLHPNPENRILHTEMIGEMNGYLHAMLWRRAGYDERAGVLRRERVYGKWVEQ